MNSYNHASALDESGLTFYVLHPLAQDFLETSCGVPHPAAGPDVEDAVVVDAADISGDADPVADVVLVEYEAVFVAASVPDVAELQASADIVAVFDVLIPVSGGAVEVDSLGHPRFFAVPNVDHYASSSSSAEVVD